ncbi:GNAT family N-acetyltransferase [Endozoicomonas lisbonensis]|uniref:BioF2-like acetyltransferase domain-containing protein n=1 Tax=Endozoicomonas lisbonensis TaxID=3120522 RepID=A0ABV2SDA6_9GAMM
MNDFSNKQKYRELCKKEHTIPIFSQDWWLDAVAGNENWGVVISEKGGDIVGALPYVFKKKYGFKLITMPKLTQTLGPWLKYPDNQKYERKLAYEKRIINDLIEGLPEYDFCKINADSSLTNWLPFYWEGFDQTTRYTYRLSNIADSNQLWNNFSGNIRKEIKKAEGRNKIVVDSNSSIEDFIEINKKTFSRQGLTLPYSKKFIIDFDKVCLEKQCRRIFFARDENNIIHAAIYIVWHNEYAYYLMGGGDPDLRNSGATSLAMWEAIKFSKTVAKCFDFEGSMIEPIENFFKAFGAIQTPYFSLSKTNSLPLALLLTAKQYSQSNK